MASYTPATSCLRAAVGRGAGGELRKRPIYQLVGQPPSGPHADAVLPWGLMVATPCHLTVLSGWRSSRHRLAPSLCGGYGRRTQRRQVLLNGTDPGGRAPGRHAAIVAWEVGSFPVPMQSCGTLALV